MKKSSISKKEGSEWADVGKAKEVTLPTGVPKLVMTGFAFQKLRFYQSLAGSDEFSCFGVALDKNMPLRITELYLPPQIVHPAQTDMKDEGVAEMFNVLKDSDLQPYQFARIWIHTHPMSVTSPTPSHLDYQTCKGVFGNCDWFVMLIRGKTDWSCYLYVMGMIPVRIELKVEIDYAEPGLPKTIVKKWTDAFKANVEKEVKKRSITGGIDCDWSQCDGCPVLDLNPNSCQYCDVLQRNLALADTEERGATFYGNHR